MKHISATYLCIPVVQADVHVLYVILCQLLLYVHLRSFSSVWHHGVQIL